MNSPTTAPADHPAPTHPRSKGWLTGVLRPAGTLDDTAFGRLLAELSATADMVIVHLDAVRIPNLAADTMRPPAQPPHGGTLAQGSPGRTRPWPSP
jgi:hypothetical protein